MGLTLLTERHADQIAGVLSCYDRILVFGPLPTVCFAEGMTSYLYAHKVRIFDYPRFAHPFRDDLRENADRLGAENGNQIEHIRKKNVPDRRLGTSATAGRRLAGEADSPQVGRVRPAVLPHLSSFRRALPLEPRSSRV